MQFTDFHIGDVVRRTERVESGTTVIKTGTIDYILNNAAYDADSNVLFETSDFNRAPVWPDIMVTLVNRPEPKIWQTASVGDLLMFSHKGTHSPEKTFFVMRLKTDKGWMNPYDRSISTIEETIRKFSLKDDKVELIRSHEK